MTEIRLKTVLLLLTALLCVETQYCVGEPQEEEVLFARRIVELYRDEEVALTLREIDSFTKQYPQSAFNESLFSMLGDCYWQTKRYDRAVEVYDKLQSHALKKKTFKNKLDCLLRLGDFEALASKQIVPDSDEGDFYRFCYAEALVDGAKHINSIEKREKLFAIAEKALADLSSSSYSYEAGLCLGKLYSKRGKALDATDLYRNMISRHPEHQEDLLLRVAEQQVKVSPAEALETISKLQVQDGARVCEAGLLKVEVLFGQGRYSEVVEEYNNLYPILSEKHKPVLLYYTAQSYFMVKEYGEVIALLEPFTLRFAGNNSTFARRMLSTLVAASFLHGELQRGDTWIHLYEESYPVDATLARLLHLKGKLHRDAKEYEKAIAAFDRALMLYPEYAYRDGIVHERNLTHLAMGDWERARMCFLSFVLDYPKSSYYAFAMRQIPYCTQKMMDALGEKKGMPDTLHRQLTEDIDRLMGSEILLDRDQKALFYMAQGKAYLACRDFSKAVESIDRACKSADNPKTLSKALLLHAQCLWEESNDIEGYITLSEKALGLEVEICNLDALHYNLFKAYLQKAQGEKEVGQIDALLSKGSEHLERALALNLDGVEPKARLWMASRYVDDIEKEIASYSFDPLEKKELIDKARESLELVQSALELTGNNDCELASEHTIYTLGKLYTWLGEREQAALLLEKLAEKKEYSAGMTSKYISEGIFALANIYSSLGQQEKAEAFYKKAIAMPDAARELKAAAKLGCCRHILHRTQVGASHDDIAKAQEALEALKMLATQKNLKTEPIHLESAFEYACNTALLSNEEERDKTLLNLLKEQKELFTSTDDLNSKDYHAAREAFPELDKIYQAYMLLIDAAITELEGKIALSCGKSKEAQWKSEAARDLIKKLHEEQHHIKGDLIQKMMNKLVFAKTAILNHERYKAPAVE